MWQITTQKMLNNNIIQWSKTGKNQILKITKWVFYGTIFFQILEHSFIYSYSKKLVLSFNGNSVYYIIIVGSKTMFHMLYFTWLYRFRMYCGAKIWKYIFYTLLVFLNFRFVEKFTEFLSSFVKSHLRRFESNTQFPILVFLNILFKYTFEQQSLDRYLSCLDVWNICIDYVQGLIFINLSN